MNLDVNYDINFMLVIIIMNLHVGVGYSLYFCALIGIKKIEKHKNLHITASKVIPQYCIAHPYCTSFLHCKGAYM